MITFIFLYTCFFIHYLIKQHINNTFVFTVPKNRGTIHVELNEWTAPLSFADTLQTEPPQPGPSLIKTQSSWISKLKIPQDKFPASLLQAMARGTRACSADRRVMVRAVVNAMREHSPNPNRADCKEVAALILLKYPGTLADANPQGGLFGKSFLTLVHTLKARIKNVNRCSKGKKK